MAVEGQLQTLLATLASGGAFPVVNDSEAIVYPYVVYQEISGVDISFSTPGTEKKRMQIDVYSETYGVTKTLGASIKNALDSTALFTTAFICKFDGYEVATGEFRQTIEYYIWV